MARQVSNEVLHGFFAEVRGYLPRIRESLDACVDQSFRPGVLKEAYRLMHSIKGTAAMLGIDQMNGVAGPAEETLEAALTSNRTLDREVVEDLRAAVQSLEDSLPPELVEAYLDPELAATVAEEFQGYLESIAERLRVLEVDKERMELLSEIRRPLHTIKGTAGIVGMVEVSGLAHRMEDLLSDLGERARAVNEAELHLLFQTTDLLGDLSAGGPMTGALAARLKATHQEYAETPKNQAVVLPTDAPPELLSSVGDQALTLPQVIDPPARPTLLPPSESFLRVRTDRLDGVLRLLGDVTLQRAGFDQQVVRMNELRAELQLNLRRLTRTARRLTTELDAGGLAASATTVSAADDNTLATPEFDSLEMDRYTKLNLLARQLDEAATDSATVGSGFESLVREVEGFQTRLEMLTRDVQERLTQLRTVRFSTLDSRLHRTVRVTAEKRNKTVALEIEGGEVELDKNVLEEIAEPMLHLLRNAVDHGIEPPEERRAAGKPDRGTIKVQVVYQGTEAMIRVQDDGAGLDLDRLRERAVALDLLNQEEAASTTGETLHPLIFQRGFSTARELSEVSGRGIGLDVVNASIAQLGGMLEVGSEPGVGTIFTIRLPGSQSILRVLLLASGGELLAVPLATIDRVESITADDLAEVDGEHSVALMGESLRALELGETLGLPPRRQDGAQRFPVVILEVGELRVALLCERILGVQEVVVRPLSELISHRLHGLGGAALTGDGRVVLVLNPNDLLRRGPTTPTLPTPAHQLSKPEILIVDDSLTVRQILSRLMDSKGWQPLVARDGQDAMELLERAPRIPDVAIIDLEMPRMDGYELTRALQAQDAYRQIPIIILTTRAGEKHRRKAFELGASDYLVKPFQESTLLETMRRITPLLSEGQK